MKKILYILFLFALIFSCSNPKNEKKSNNDIPNFSDAKNTDFSSISVKNKDSVLAKLNLYYENIWKNSDLSGGILVAQGDEILLEKYQGFGRENEQMPIGKDTPLHIASITKPITAMAILKLVEHKKLSLNQKVNSILSDFPYPEMTLFDLLSHRSGLPRYENFLEENGTQPKKTFFTNQELLDFLQKNKPDLVKKPNTGFMYNNLNYSILASIIEKITKKSYPEAMKLMIFEPLEMKNSFVFEEKHLMIATQSFYQKDNKLYPLDRYDLIYGDKNIYTTPRDLLKFSKAMFSEKFLPKNIMNQIFTPYSNEKEGINNYGLGVRLKMFDNGKKLTYHNGWWHGSNTVFVHLRESKTTIIALGNRYSNRIYSAVSLSSLFEDFPYELEKVIQPTNPNNDNLME